MIGLGRLGQEILGRISRDYDVTCVSMEQDAAETLKALKREDVELIKGDATSRLVLEECRIEEAEAVIITITTEKISREIASVLKDHFTPRRVISVAVTGETTDMLLGMGFEVDNIFASTATDIRNRIEHKTKAAHAIGLGKEEILEVEVHPQSRLANKPLGFLKPLKWRIGILYREGNIIIPKADTVLKPRDRVVVLGDPQVLRTVAEILTFNYQKFPLDYGTSLIVLLSGREDQDFFDELNYVHSTFPIRKVWIIRTQRVSSDEFERLLDKIEIKDAIIKKTALSPLGALKDALSDCGQTQGLVMVSSELLDSFYSGFVGASGKSFVKEALSLSRCPLLISRGVSPYHRMAVPCVVDVELDVVVETALQISDEISNDVTAMYVAPSPYLSADEEAETYDNARTTVASMSMAYKSRVETLDLKGNPVKAVLGALEGHDLMIVSMDSSENDNILSGLFKPHVSWNLIKRCLSSALVLPCWEETL